ncbi:MAG: hypothetical protein M3N19_04050, partial [Candidatus Eremiobacteraeota bacterium]|nr:hypothetical protein [Candidatus Eremiobacteraeota bacterium]
GLTSEVPKVPADTTDAVVFLGAEDLGALVPGNDVIRVEGLLKEIVTTLKNRGIAVHLITLRNYSLDPKFANPKPNKSKWQADTAAVVQSIDDFELSLGVPTLDIRAHPDLMDSATYSDGVSFNAGGQRLIASYIMNWFRHCDTNGKCVTERSVHL